MSQLIERVILDMPRSDVSYERIAAAAEAGRIILSAIPGVELVLFGMALAAAEPYQVYVRIRLRDEPALEAFDAQGDHHAFVQQQWAPLLAEHTARDYRIAY